MMTFLVMVEGVSRYDIAASGVYMVVCMCVYVCVSVCV
jgi:hypothetical protein